MPGVTPIDPATSLENLTLEGDAVVTYLIGSHIGVGIGA
jgi:hypothetical protein